MRNKSVRWSATTIGRETKSVAVAVVAVVDVLWLVAAAAVVFAVVVVAVASGDAAAAVVEWQQRQRRPPRQQLQPPRRRHHWLHWSDSLVVDGGDVDGFVSTDAAAAAVVATADTSARSGADSASRGDC